MKTSHKQNLLAAALVGVLGFAILWSLGCRAQVQRRGAASRSDAGQGQTELLGELDFFDGMPSEATVKKTYDFLDTVPWRGSLPQRHSRRLDLRDARRHQGGRRRMPAIWAFSKSFTDARSLCS